MFTKEMVNQVVEKLKEDKIYTSEIHFQTRFIVVASLLFEDFSFIPEVSPKDIPDDYSVRFENQKPFFDLVVVDNKTNEQTLIEFKYMTKQYSEEINNFNYSLKSHEAMDIRRYDCWRDISRIEYFVENSNQISNGFLVLITNVLAFEKKARGFASEFEISEGFHEKGNKNWDAETGTGTKKGRGEIQIHNDYEFKYETFYQANNNERNNLFKVLIVDVNK